MHRRAVALGRSWALTIPTESRAEAKPSVDEGRGRVVAARGSVLDIEFRTGALPRIREALAVDWDVGLPLSAEVQQHLDPHRVRAVALQGSGGLKRGTPVRNVGKRLRALRLDASRALQEEVTTELLDLVTGEQAVSNDQRGAS